MSVISPCPKCGRLAADDYCICGVNPFEREPVLVTIHQDGLFSEPTFTVSKADYDKLKGENDQLWRDVERLRAQLAACAAENAELRKQSDEDMEAFLDMARISEDYAAQLTQVQSELAAANATLDALRDLCGPNKTISNRTCMKMVDILYPQPKEPGDADE